MMKLPPCGLYKTTAPIGSIPAGRLVLFHNHGDPGPGIYLPGHWKGNRMKASTKGTVLPSPEDAQSLSPLPPEGFYHTLQRFHCCAKRCREYAPSMLVQLGYNAHGEPILFVPQIVDGMLAIPERGRVIDEANLELIEHLHVDVTDAGTIQ